MKIVVTGDRDWLDVQAVEETLVKFKASIIIEGEARGLDTIARNIGLKLGLVVHKFPANWKEHGKAAGPIRNKQMLDQKPDIVLAFHDDLQNSKGTRHCVKQALKMKLQVFLITHEKDNLLITEIKECK